MKYLIAVILISLSGYVMANQKCEKNPNNPNCSGDYPGYTPDWDSRYSVGCSMTNNETKATSFEFSHGNLDYAEGGSMMVYLQGGIEQWYMDLKDAAEDEGVDARLVPDLNAATTLKRFISGEFDQE